MLGTRHSYFIIASKELLTSFCLLFSHMTCQIFEFSEALIQRYNFHTHVSQFQTFFKQLNRIKWT